MKESLDAWRESAERRVYEHTAYEHTAYEPKVYEPPRLRLHGKLETLTRGGTQAVPEDFISGTQGGT